MHPIFVSAGKTEAVPILFVTARTIAETTKGLDARAQEFVRAGRI